MASGKRLLVTAFLSLFLLIVAVRGNAGLAGKLRSRPRNQLKPTRVAAALPEEDLLFQLSSKEGETGATPDADSELNDVDWSPGKRGRDHGKKLSFSDFYVSRGKKLNPDMFYVSRGRRDVAYGLGDAGRTLIQRVSSGSGRLNGLGGMAREKWSGRGFDSRPGSMRSRLVDNVRDLKRIKRGTQRKPCLQLDWASNLRGRSYHTEEASRQLARKD